MNAIGDIRIVDVPSFPDKQGLLVAYTGLDDFGMEIQRVFIVTGVAESIRGKHAHRCLNQILICARGTVRIACDDGTDQKVFVLDRADCALVLPSGIWAEQIYVDEGSTLVVLCDLPYDKNDYIRNYEEFLLFRKGSLT